MWYCIRTVNVLGQMSPHLRPLLSVVVTVLAWGLQQGCVGLGRADVSRQALGMESAAFSHECGKVPKWPLHPWALTTRSSDGAVVTPVDLNATWSLADGPACVSHPQSKALKEPKCGCCSREPRPFLQPVPRWWLMGGRDGGGPRLGCAAP